MNNKICEDLIARKRVYRFDNKFPISHSYRHQLISDKTEIYKNINNDEVRNNIDKADFIIDALEKYEIKHTEEDFSQYFNIKQVNAIIIRNNQLHTVQSNTIERYGWEICGIDLTYVIMFEFITYDNMIIRFDFEGMINNEEHCQIVYFQHIGDVSQQQCIDRTNQFLEDFFDNYIFDYVYTRYNDSYDNMHSINNLKGYDDKYDCMIEIFSNLVDPSDYKPSELTGDVVTDEYIDAIVKERDRMRRLAKEIECRYKEQGIKVTLSKWNVGCEYGMAIYVWIPSQ